MLRVMRTECDTAMARSKGLAQGCSGHCMHCVAAILIDEEGQREHCTDLKPNGGGQQPMTPGVEGYRKWVKE